MRRVLVVFLLGENAKVPHQEVDLGHERLPVDQARCILPEYELELLRVSPLHVANVLRREKTLVTLFDWRFDPVEYSTLHIPQIDPYWQFLNEDVQPPP